MCNVQESNDRPKWLLELESRKRKPRLAHEAGAGAPCMICNADCPGLDLHFWRKICKNCKCSRDDHDFEDDDFPQFDMLFGPTKKFKRKPVCKYHTLRVNNEKQHEGEATFEWVPPNTTKELATDYMKALPLEKLPIKGSAGAALRRQLLQKQLPLHDIDHKVCDELSEQEKKQFEKYLENIKNYVGQGKVTKVLGARPFDRSLMTPANATDMQRFSPQHKPNILASTVQLRTPSSFNPKSSYLKNLNDNQNKQESPNARRMPVLEKYNVLSSCNSNETAKSEPVKNGIYNKTSTPLNCGKLDFNSQNPATAGVSVANDDHLKLPPPPAITNTGSTEIISGSPLKTSRQEYNDVVKDPLASLVHSQTINNDARIAESILADAFLPPSSIHANDIIGSTLDESRLMFIREKLTDKYSNQENQTLHGIPPTVARELDGNDLLRRVNNVASNAQQFTNVHGENGRPSVIAGMKSLSEVPAASEDTTKKAEKDKEESKSVRAERDVTKPISQLVQSIPLDPSLISNETKKAQMKEHALNATHGTSSHPVSRITEHFDRYPQVLNSTTNSSDPTSDSLTKAHSQLLADSYNAKLSSSTTPSNIIHSEKLYNQIFPYGVNDSVQQTQNLPNVEHLKGAMEELTMDSVKREKCHKCEEEIHVGDVVVTTDEAKNATWHPGCFVCSMCNELLVDLVYFHYKNKLYCGRDLATLLGIPRCFACDELIFVREYTVAEGHNYHVKHFCCWDCDVPLAGQQYITENDRPLCIPCFQKTYAKTCNACKKVIAADQQGVAVKNLNFHAMEECFCCYTCKKNLLNGRMAIKEDRLFCSKECISKFLHPQT